MIVNFGRNVRFAPRHVYAPTTEAEVLAILDRHAVGKIRVGGALHSWSPAVASDDVFIDLWHFDSVSVERDAGGTVWATVGGGCRLKHLLRKLHRLTDYTVPTLGLITEQTIAGAISTATHGSGRPSVSHYAEELQVAAYDPDTGRARIYEWKSGTELRAARCALGCMGVILSVRFRLVPPFDVTEMIVRCATLDAVLAVEEQFPLQQFYLVPHSWKWYVQRRTVAPRSPGPRSLRAQLYRSWWFAAIDVGLSLAARLTGQWVRRPAWTRFFYRHVMPRLIVTNTTVTDRNERMLVMEHELFRHSETELYVPARHVRRAATFVRAVLEVFDGSAAAPPPDVAAELDSVGMLGELERHRGTFTHHYPVTFRRVLPDDALISTSCGDEPRYALSFITYAEPRDDFSALATFLARSMARLFDARPHWGKWFPLDGSEVERLYPNLAEFRVACDRVDPRGVFRNEFVERVLFGGRVADAAARR